jgi:hypothetical protein
MRSSNSSSSGDCCCLSVVDSRLRVVYSQQNSGVIHESDREECVVGGAVVCAGAFELCGDASFASGAALVSRSFLWRRRIVKPEL